ncbi:MAG TPA: ComEC/Rec2 family competence protein [Longimicrobiales bacterium]|nr:ComEC/Rec2 family competence protein [Longimicrobiales bacterium]
MARLALAFSGGAAFALLPGRFSLPALFAALAALAPIPSSRSPRVRAALCVVVAAGCLAGMAGRGQAEAGAPAPTGFASAWRARLVERLDTLYGPRAPVLAALALAETADMDRDLREDFARSGTTHLLSISGFHVGVVAGLVLALLRALRASRRSAALGAAAASWLYVAVIGFPDAAVRSALMLTAVAASRARGRPPARWGGLGAALLALVALDPLRLTSAGFQLSFAGAAGLVGWAGPLRRRLRRACPRWTPDALIDGVAAGTAATLATLPIVAWHFERVSIVGIPATLLATPCVVLALPGVLASLAADAVHPAAGRFLAGGTGLALDVLVWVARAAAAPSWASVWVPRGWVSVGVAGAVVGARVANELRGRARTGVLVAGAAAGIVAWPGLLALQSRGTAELLVVDVGQGDAIAVRTPRGRWLLVDAGPAWEGDPGASPVVRSLRRRGVRTLEALVLTHPDLDHVGGAPAVLASFPVGEILDPGEPAGKSAYVAVLEAASRLGIPWRQARAGDLRSWDGLDVRVLHPDSGHAAPAGGDTDSNDASVVLAVAFGSFDALLTGDAPTSVERGILAGVSPDLEVL